MKKTIKDFDLSNKKVIVRCDFNVPIEDNKITDDTRIRESIPTIQYIIDQRGKAILLSHLGRIKSEADKVKNSLAPVAKRLSELLNKEVIFIPYTRGKEIEDAINNMQNGDVVLLENTRFEDADGEKESKNNEELGQYWASLGDIFINDAFGTCHRAHASNVGIASNLPNGLGFLVERELEKISYAIDNPTRPYMVIMGGAKVSDKIGVIENLVKFADKILIGGGMCFTFLKALGYNVGQSLVEDDYLDFCKQILTDYKEKIILPVDINVALEYSPNAKGKIVNINMINYNEMGLDIGPETIKLFKETLSSAKTIVWNGPLGVVEFSNFANGTKQICEFIARQNIKVIIGGGDSAAFVHKFGLVDKIFHISTGGGATLELLEGKKLPGIEIMANK